MFARIVVVGSFSLLAVLASAGNADAFGRRGGGGRSTPTPCYTPCPTTHDHCWPCPTWHHHHCWPCPPCGDCGVFTESSPAVPLKGPFPTLVRGAKVGHGVYVHVDVPSGSPMPTGTITLKQKGPGEFRYVGYNTCSPAPANHVRYSVFLCPTKAGADTIELEFVLADGTKAVVPYAFDIAP